MSGKEGGSDISNNGKANNGISGVIPLESRKIIQSLKEVVNLSEAEIYATLKDCDMDPNDAVNRLLSLDPFREVKSKKEKKKENKDTTDTSFRGASSTSHCGSKGGEDRHGRSGPTHLSSYDPAVSHNKLAYRKENGVHAYAGASSSASGVPGNSNIRRPPSLSQPMTMDNNGFTTSTVDRVLSSSQPPAGFQSAWLGSEGQVSMTDIVKMGKPQNKDSAMAVHQGFDNHHAVTSPSTASVHDLHSSKGWNFHEIKLESDASMHADGNDEWEYIEYPPDAGVASSDSHLYSAPSSLPYDQINQHLKSEVDNIPSTEDPDAEALTRNRVLPTSAACRNIQDGSGSSSLFDNNFHERVDSYHSHNAAFEHDKAKDGVSLVASNLKQLSLHNDDQDQDTSDEENDCSVKIPDHLQVHALECPHLSFGSFRSGITSGVSGSFASRPLENNLEETSEALDASFLGDSDTRNNECYVDECLRNVDDENIVRRTGVNAETYDSYSVSRSDVVKDEAPVVPQGNQYMIPSAEHGYVYNNSQQLDTTYASQQTSAQIQHVSPMSSLLQAYTDSLPSAMLASDVRTDREPDLFDSPVSMTQPMPTKYGVAATSFNDPSIPISEALRLSNTNQATPQTLSGVNVANRPSQPHQPAVHPYLQPNLPFANSIRYPFLPQSYPYLPSSFQHNFSNNNAYPESLAAMRPQYKNSASLNSLLQSSALASGYGLGTTNNVATGNFPLNLPTASAGTNFGYGDVLGSQYNVSNHLGSLQQNENSAMWVNGLGSQNMSSLLTNSYYNLQSQQQHHHQGGYRPGQQASQHFGGNGCPNYYSQTGMLPEHQIQQANTREVVALSSLLGQGQSPTQNQQLWQNSC